VIQNVMSALFSDHCPALLAASTPDHGEARGSGELHRCEAHTSGGAMN